VIVPPVSPGAVAPCRNPEDPGIDERPAAPECQVAEFDTSLPHRFGPAGDEPVEILSLFDRHGGRMHVRAAPEQVADEA
jgi:hypothetical protein